MCVYADPYVCVSFIYTHTDAHIFLNKSLLISPVHPSLTRVSYTAASVGTREERILLCPKAKFSRKIELFVSELFNLPGLLAEILRNLFKNQKLSIFLFEKKKISPLSP